jgi:hypothetical protein
MAGFQGSLGRSGERVMNGIITTLVTLLSIAAYTLLADPAAAQSPHSSSAPVGCTGDYVCGDDPSVVATWPLDRWTTVRRSDRQVATPRTADRLPSVTRR